ncbi:MAG: gluconate 2-dehydrogenase subunit 3 family protein [Candidatus Binatia bacterium]
MTVDVTRREFLRLGGMTVAVMAIPACHGSSSSGPGASAGNGRFFTVAEYQTIDAAVARLIPDDVNPNGSPSPGAGPARVVDYIDRFLGAFNTDQTPFVFAGGPSSDRNPLPDSAYCGGPVPPNGPGMNALATAVPLSRRQEISWKATILGTKALGAEASFLRANNVVLGLGDANGDTDGLQDVYRRGISDLNAFANELFGADFAALAPPQQDIALNLLSNQDFVGMLFGHTVEGMYANPEYGGNQPADATRAATGADGDNRPIGWAYIGFEGDRQPLGYTVFDPATQGYCEIASHPMSTADPGADSAPLSAGVIAQLPQLLAGLRLRR